MAEITMAEVNTAIKALLDNPQVDYKIGDKRVDAGQKLKQLMAYKKFIIDNPPADDSDLLTMHFNTSVNEFGEEVGEYED